MDLNKKTFRPIKKAEDLAAKLNADKQDDWTYVVVECKFNGENNGRAYIKILDEFGVEVGTM